MFVGIGDGHHPSYEYTYSSFSGVGNSVAVLCGDHSNASRDVTGLMTFRSIDQDVMVQMSGPIESPILFFMGM